MLEHYNTQTAKWKFPECLSNLTTVGLPRISLTMCRGVQHVYCMMHKCIMLKIGAGRKNTLIRSKTHKSNKNRGKFNQIGGHDVRGHPFMTSTRTWGGCQAQVDACGWRRVKPHVDVHTEN